jgi:hypothetical protein
MRNRDSKQIGTSEDEDQFKVTVLRSGDQVNEQP